MPGEYAPCRTSRVAGAQELFKYRRDEGGFTGWLATRLPTFSQNGAYEAIRIFKAVGNFTEFGKLSNAAILQAAQATPDIQALIAERVQAGEIFTAAKVKEIMTDRAVALAFAVS